MVSKSREAAFAALRGFYAQKKFSAAVVEGIHRNDLDQRDSALAVNIVLGVIQNRDYLDYYLKEFSGREVSSMDLNLRVILEEAAYQILFLTKIPFSAAVNEAVGMAKIYAARASGLVNAVLRKLSSQVQNNTLPKIKTDDEVGDISVRYSCSYEFTAYLCEHYGIGFAEDYLKAANSVPPLTVRINLMRITPEQYGKMLSEANLKYAVSNLLKDSFLVIDAGVNRLPGFEEGLCYIQDEAAGFVTELLDPKPGMSILDCCSSPGGKSFSAAIGLKGDCNILSCDINAKKTALVESGYLRLGILCGKTEVRDATRYVPEYDSQFDAVICDVPCSGFGVLRKKPEIKYKLFSDIARLPEIQSDILHNVSQYVVPGGILIYSTCTVLEEENEAVIRKFLDENKQFEPMDFNRNGVKSQDGMFTFWPHINGTDGFFVAKLKRKSE